MERIINTLRKGLPKGLEELAELGRTLLRRREDIGASNEPVKALNGPLEHFPGIALGFRNLDHDTVRYLIHTGPQQSRINDSKSIRVRLMYVPTHLRLLKLQTELGPGYVLVEKWDSARFIPQYLCSFDKTWVIEPEVTSSRILLSEICGTFGTWSVTGELCTRLSGVTIYRYEGTPPLPRPRVLGDLVPPIGAGAFVYPFRQVGRSPHRTDNQLHLVENHQRQNQ